MDNIPDYRDIAESDRNRITLIIVYFLIACTLVGQPQAWAGADHDHDHDAPVFNGGGPSPGSFGRRPQESGGRPGPAGCRVLPGTLASFANGERYDYSSMVTYLTSPGCAMAAPEISQLAISQGVDFSRDGAIKLAPWAESLKRSAADGNKRLDIALRRAVPNMMLGAPMGTNELLPIVGQLALISPTASRFTLGQVIKNELILGDDILQMSDSSGRQASAINLAQTLIRLGASESLIASEMAASAEEMAVLAQADSLAKYLRALSAAASVEASLVPTFNLTAGALNRGVQKGKQFYSKDSNEGLLNSVFTAIRAALGASPALEPGSAELNEALGVLLNGDSLAATELIKAWKDVIRILAVSTTQGALADAMSVSLTPEFIFLINDEQENLMLAAKNYPQMAGAIQLTFLKSWEQMWNDVNAGVINVAKFNEMKSQYFAPMVSRILDLDPYLIDPTWLGTVIEKKLVSDSDIEKRFPRFVLAFLDRRDRASKVATMENGLEPTVSSLAENFAVLWTLSSIHMPALFNWVKKHDE